MLHVIQIYLCPFNIDDIVKVSLKKECKDEGKNIYTSMDGVFHDNNKSVFKDNIGLMFM